MFGRTLLHAAILVCECVCMNTRGSVLCPRCGGSWVIVPSSMMHRIEIVDVVKVKIKPGTTTQGLVWPGEEFNTHKCHVTENTEPEGQNERLRKFTRSHIEITMNAVRLWCYSCKFHTFLMNDYHTSIWTFNFSHAIIFSIRTAQYGSFMTFLFIHLCRVKSCLKSFFFYV